LTVGTVIETKGVSTTSTAVTDVNRDRAGSQCKGSLCGSATATATADVAGSTATATDSKNIDVLNAGWQHQVAGVKSGYLVVGVNLTRNRCGVNLRLAVSSCGWGTRFCVADNNYTATAITGLAVSN
jgi:hypothetical protein